LRDKRLGGAADRLAELASEIILTEPAVERAWDAHRALAWFPQGRQKATVRIVPEVPNALQHALGSGAEVVLVLGSHYLLGEVLPALAARRGIEAAELLAPAEPRLQAAG
jgi:folylpolyglutamate synthase/dihydropteroate synthase